MQFSPLNAIFDNQGNINYDEVNRQATAILNGTACLDRLSLAEEQGRCRGGRTNVEISLILGANAGSSEAQRGGIERQESLIEVYARDKQIWLEPTEFSDLISEGDEAKVYPSLNPGKLLKLYNYKRFSKTPLDFLDNRISLHNHIFEESTNYSLVGFTTTEDFTGKQTLAFVLEQPHISGIYIKRAELIVEMHKRGFEYKLENFKPVFYNQKYVVKDLHERNVLKDVDGNLFFIDTVPFLNTASLNLGGNRVYGGGAIKGIKAG